MSSGRGSTRAGRASPLPGSGYRPELRAHLNAGNTAVQFRGEDGRERVFDVGSLPLPDWHAALAAAWSARTGPAGELRTLASVTGAWSTLKRFMLFVSQLPRPPKTPSALAVEHVDAFRRFRGDSTSDSSAAIEIRQLGLLFDCAPLNRVVSPKTLDRLHPRTRNRARRGVSGYSDAELARITAAARADVRKLKERLELPENEHDPAVRAVLRSGRIATIGISATRRTSTRKAVAEQLFVTRDDLYPVLALLILTTGWNLEAIKELPLSHRIIEGRAVELDVLKRRRGPGRWHNTVTWEIGATGQELYSPGGLYLLLHRLMEPARRFLVTPTFWAVWHHFADEDGRECRDPFAKSLNASLRWSRWVERHQLTADPPDLSGPATAPDSVPHLLRLTANRLKTSVDVRRTRQLGGHLPSAARSNSTRVLFRNYLSGDRTTVDWAQETVSDAFVDVERAAYDAHRRALTRTGNTALRVLIDPPAAETAPDHDTVPRSETAWTACSDHEHHPLTGRRCTVSFLDCFHCGNCVVTPDHLPRLISLLDALEERRAKLSDADWWTRYGSVWAAIRHDVLPKFSESEVAAAHRHRPSDSLLDLVEPEWERP